VNQYFESKECFSVASCKVLCEFLTEVKISHGSENFSRKRKFRIIINGVVSPEHYH